MGHDTKQEFCCSLRLSLLLLPIDLLIIIQDTVIAMQALSRFSEVTFTSQLNKTVTFDIQDLTADPLTITDKTRFERKEYQVLMKKFNSFCATIYRDAHQDKNNYLFRPGSQCTKQFELYKLVR